jgi:hypothetical protein
MKDYEVFFKASVDDNFNIVLQGDPNIKRRFMTPFKNLPDLVVTISAKKPSKTKAQLGLWFGYILPQCMEFHKKNTGEEISKQLMHITICTTILNAELHEVTVNGRLYIDAERFKFSKADLGDINEAIDKTVKHYAELGLAIDLPSDRNNFTFSSLQDE